MRARVTLWLPLSTLLLFGACQGTVDAPTLSTAAAVDARVRAPDRGPALDAVLRWNVLVMRLAPALVPNGPLTPFIESRLYAITQAAVHDALNGIRPRYARYAAIGAVDRDADPAAAVVSAGYHAMLGALPAATHATIQAAYDADIAALRSTGDAARIDAGIAVGERAAAAVLARRANDNTDKGVGPYVPGTQPGDYRFTFPFNTPDFDVFGTGGFADANLWGSVVTTFVVRNGAQFRAPPPYGAPDNAAAVRTAQYTRDFNEIKAIGCDVCAARTAEQTTIAKFWVESPPAQWDRIARTLAARRHYDAWELARLLALLQMAEFDAYATAGESKFHYNLWRPVTAMALADTDGNPATSSVANWQVLVFPTPPVPDYPSAHALGGGAAAAVLSGVMGGTGPFEANSESLPGVVRRFTSANAAARENADSRIFVGYHFRHATDVGLSQGTALGAWVVRHALRPRRD